MAKKIRFPLKMRNGAEVRTLDELKENFDLESVLGYFTDGKLATWLADRYYDDKAEAVSALSADTPELNAKLCDILEVEYQGDDDVADLEYIQRRNEKLRILSAFTDNKDILNNIDIVAMSQDELFDILDEQPEKVYLYGEKFSIPFGAKNVCYIGVNNTIITIDKTKYVFEYNEAGISFKNVRYDDTVNPYVTRGELLYLDNRYKEAFPLVKEAAENGNPRAMYLLSRYYFHGFNVVHTDIEERNKWCQKAYQYNEPLSSFGYAEWCLKNNEYERNQAFPKIFKIIKSMAEGGDILAQVILGYMYNNSRGTEKNSNEANKWFNIAAISNDTVSQYNLALEYYAKKEYSKAEYWYKKAAEKGYSSAQDALGDMYYDGKVGTQDYAEAFKWYNKAANQGNKFSQLTLGFMYKKGLGIERNYAKAIEFYRKSADQGYEYAQYNLGWCYEEGKAICQDYSKAIEWYKKAAEQEFPEALCALGRAYYHGYGVPKDYLKAIEWYKKAAIYECSEAEFQLGYIYGTGLGVTKDKQKAIEWFKKAAIHGDETAKDNLTTFGVYL